MDNIQSLVKQVLQSILQPTAGVSERSSTHGMLAFDTVDSCQVLESNSLV